MLKVARLAALLPIASIAACGEQTSEPGDDPDGDPLVIRLVSEDDPTIPVEGVQVRVNDGDWATSDADGSVSFPAIEAPYTVLVYQSYYGMITDTYFDDVWALIDQHANPLVIAVDSISVDSPHCVVTGTVTGASGDPGTEVLLGGGGAPYNVVASDGTFWVSVQQALDPVELRAFELAADGSVPRFAVQTVQLEPGSSCDTSDVTLDLQPAPQESASGQIVLPTALAAAESRVFTELAFPASPEPETRLPGIDLPAPPSGTTVSFDVSFPRVEGAEANLYVVSSLASGAWASNSIAVSPPSTDLRLELPPPVELVAPADGATAAPETLFEWEAHPTAARYSLGAVCEAPEAAGPDHLINFRRIETTATRASLPSLPGVDMSAGWTCDWYVAWYPLDADIDFLPPYYEGPRSLSAQRSITFE